MMALLFYTACMRVWLDGMYPERPARPRLRVIDGGRA